MNIKYTEEFKQDAIDLSEEIGCKETAEKLNINIKNLYNWRKRNRITTKTTPIKGLQPGETPEQGIKRLEKEANELRQANEVLRKALGFMAVH